MINFIAVSCAHAFTPDVKPTICPIFTLIRAISLLPCPEHHIRIPGKTQSGDTNVVGNPFPFLKLDIIGRDNMGKQRLDFIDRKESSGADIKY